MCCYNLISFAVHQGQLTNDSKKHLCHRRKLMTVHWLNWLFSVIQTKTGISHAKALITQEMLVESSPKSLIQHDKIHSTIVGKQQHNNGMINTWADKSGDLQISVAYSFSDTITSGRGKTLISDTCLVCLVCLVIGEFLFIKGEQEVLQRRRLKWKYCLKFAWKYQSGIWMQNQIIFNILRILNKKS